MAVLSVGTTTPLTTLRLLTPCVLTAAVREGEAWEYCPRTALRRAQALLLEHFGLTLKVRVC